MGKIRDCANIGFLFMFASILCACAIDARDVAPNAQRETQPAETTPASPPDSSEKIADKAARAIAQSELNSLIALYNNGDFHGAIKRFGAIDDTLRPYKEMELQGLKLTAFSYCLTGHAKLCKLQFERALKLDPAFDLEKGERGHPLWQPVFDRAKKERG